MKLSSIPNVLLQFFLRKKFLGAILLVALVLVVFFVFQNANPRSGYIFETAKKTDLTEVVSESGTITADGNVQVYSPTNGIIADISVANNQQVWQGQQLFTVNSSASQQEKATALANYLAANAALDADNAALFTLQSSMFDVWKTYRDLATNSTYENADKSPNTTNRVLPEFLIAQDNWLAAEANYKNQQGVLAKDQAALSSAYTAYLTTQTTTVTAPLNGIIENVSYTAGNSVQTPTPLSPTAKPVLLLSHSKTLEAVIPVGQTHIAKIQIGQSVTIKPDAYKDKTYTGTVSRIDSMGENIQGVVTYNVYVDLTSDEFVKSGMTFDSDIVTKKLSDILTVPNSAIVLDKGKPAVRVFEKNAVRFVPVTTGVKGETRTQILSGISQGQEIIVSLTNERAQKPGFLGL